MVSQKEFNKKLDEHITREPIYYDELDGYADKQVVDDLIKDFNITITKVNTIIKTQNNVIDKLKIFEEFVCKKMLNIKKENSKLSKDIKVERTNNFLLEDKFNKLNSEIVRLKLRVDLMDKFIQNFLVNKHKGKFTKKDIIKIQKDFINDKNKYFMIDN